MDTIQPKTDTKPTFSLVVIRPFFYPPAAKNFQAGDEIKDAATVSDLLASELAGNCNKVAA